MKYLKRILALPFFLMLNIIGMVFMLFKLSKAFMLFGGEAVAYVKKNEQKTITDIYQQLQYNYQNNHQSIVKPDLVPYHTICASCRNGGMCGCTIANTMVRNNNL
jgi:flagellar motor component MotA